MGGLPMFALMLAAARRQAILGRRSAREELEAKRTERELRKQELEARIKDREKQSALEAWKPFSDVIYRPEGADVMNRMATGGTIHSFFDQAAEAAKAAGVPFDKSVWQVPPPTAPQEAQVVMPPPPMVPDVVAEQMLPPGLAPPPAVPQPVSQFTPGPSQAELYQQRYQPSLKTLQGQQRADAGDLRAQAYRLSVEHNIPIQDAEAFLRQQRGRSAAAQADVDEATVFARIDKLNQDAANAEAQGDLIRAQTLRTQAQTETDNYLRVRRGRVMETHSSALESLPGYRKATVAATLRGQELDAASEAADRATRVSEGALDRAERQAGRAAKPGGMTDVDKKNWDFHAARLRQTNKTAAGEDEPAYPPGSPEYQESAAELDRLRSRYGQGSGQPGLPDFAGGRAAPIDAGTLNDARELIRTGQFKSTLEALRKQNNPLAETLQRAYVQLKGKKP